VSEIRNCTREDIPAVASLFQKTFLKLDGKPPPASLEAHLAEIYLDHPWYDPAVASRVHVNEDRRVTGFVGVFPGRFTFDDRLYRAAIAGSLMVEDPERDPLAGAKLLRSVIKGSQDISISETTNLLSQGLWERLDGSVVTPLSLDWFRVLRPASAALGLLAERHPVAAALEPAAWIGDRIGRRWTERHLQPVAPSPRLSRQTDAPASELATAIRELSELSALRPAWSEEEIGWFLRHAAKKERYGAIQSTIVRDTKGKLAGCYLYHAKPAGTGRVLQVLARPDAADDVIDCLFYEAAETRLSVLRGRCTPRLANALQKRDCMFVRLASTVIYTAHPKLAAAITSGEALITGLAGESWTRLIGGSFT